MSKYIKCILILLAAAATPSWADPTVAVVPADLDEIRTLDEVIVTGERSLSSARMAIERAEDRFYARWNELNDDRRFDVACRNETPRDHPSRITRRVCQPAFVEDAEVDSSQVALREMQGGISADGKTVSLTGAVPMKMIRQAEFQKRTLAMLDKDPELRGALLQHARLKQHYEELRKEKFKDRWILWK